MAARAAGSKAKISSQALPWARPSEYHTLGEHHFPVAEFCKNLAQTAYYAQMNFVPPFWFHGTSPALYSADEIQAKARGQAAQLAAKLQAWEAA